jgi:thiamine transport system substrate-binding protein
MQQIIEGKYQVIITDPRSCASGFGLLAWIKAIYKDDAKNKWHNFKKNIVTITKNWSEAYALFLKNEADLVISYTTSPVFHILIENNHNYASTIFSEGNFVQIETVAKIRNSPNENLADQFMEFILSKDFQKLAPLYNYMYPVIKFESSLPAAYLEINEPTKILFFSPEEIFKNKKSLLLEWLQSF